VNNGVISVPINDSLLEGADVPVEIEMCPAGNCTLDVSFPSLTITPVDGGADPDRLEIAVQVDLSSNRNTPVTVIGQQCTFNFQTDDTGAQHPERLGMELEFAEDADGYGLG
jgi:hypothetical protein